VLVEQHSTQTRPRSGHTHSSLTQRQDLVDQPVWALSCSASRQRAACKRKAARPQHGPTNHTADSTPDDTATSRIESMATVFRHCQRPEEPTGKVTHRLRSLHATQHSCCESKRQSITQTNRAAKASASSQSCSQVHLSERSKRQQATRGGCHAVPHAPQQPHSGRLQQAKLEVNGRRCSKKSYSTTAATAKGCKPAQGHASNGRSNPAQKDTQRSTAHCWRLGKVAGKTDDSTHRHRDARSGSSNVVAHPQSHGPGHTSNTRLCASHIRSIQADKCCVWPHRQPSSHIRAILRLDTTSQQGMPRTGL
jgi:hypothetical protein